MRRPLPKKLETGGQPLTRLGSTYFDGTGSTISDVNKETRSSININHKNDRGWTALMLASRNGQSGIIKLLLEKGCNTDIINSTGQTALDIAMFWNQKDAANILSQHYKTGNPDQQVRNYFSLNHLRRCAEKRKDLEWQKSVFSQDSTKYILFSELKAFLLPLKGNGRWNCSLARFGYNEVKCYLENHPVVVFLGEETIIESNGVTSPLFAIEMSSPEELALKTKYEDGFYMNPFPGAVRLEPSEAGIFAEARSLLAWHERYRFCATCGSPTTVEELGYKRTCNNKKCSSHEGVHNTCHPRLDPTVIMNVVSPDGKQCLLGRKKTFPPKMWSCLAGFIEPGETIEDTCRREVLEESNIEVGKVEYHSSQPWPFPATLMLGVTGWALTDNIKVDEDEMEDVRWFSRPEVVQMMTRQHPQGFFVPPEQAIAHQLIKSWVRKSSNL
ncbi:hypothetical protein ScPMuIL_017674 [Solemya velum]